MTSSRVKIFLAGGGTGGPTAPLLAVAAAVAQLAPDAELFLIGTRGGVEEKLLAVAPLKIKYFRIPAGKWRRYFSIKNFFDLGKVFFGFWWSLYLIRSLRPNVIFGAGSFVQVPLAVAAWLLRVPVVIHQQDFQILLSTKLIAPLAHKITLTFSFHQKKFASNTGLFRKFPKAKTIITGNPVRPEIFRGDREQARAIFHLAPDRPTILVIGGGGGAAGLNQLVTASLDELLRYVQIIHLTGPGHRIRRAREAGYQAFEFLDKELPDAYAAADLVICRAGMSTISELAALGKPAILVPLPDSPQEYNARLLKFLRSAVVLPQTTPAEQLVETVRKILWNGEVQASLSGNIRKLMPPHADRRIARLLLQIAKEKNHGK